jgi:hypothetical protein
VVFSPPTASCVDVSLLGFLLLIPDTDLPTSPPPALLASSIRGACMAVDSLYAVGFLHPHVSTWSLFRFACHFSSYEAPSLISLTMLLGALACFCSRTALFPLCVRSTWRCHRTLVDPHISCLLYYDLYLYTLLLSPYCPSPQTFSSVPADLFAAVRREHLSCSHVSGEFASASV